MRIKFEIDFNVDIEFVALALAILEIVVLVLG